MKLIRTAVALALSAAAPVFAATTVLDFEGTESFASVGNFYSGVSFGGDVLGLAQKDDVMTYFTNAPSALGAMTVVGSDATMNVASGFTGSLSFYYSSSAFTSNAVTVYSGLNGTGFVLASFNLTNNATANGCSSSSYCYFDQLSSTFSGTAHSITFGNSANVAVFDNISVNISAVPEASTTLMMALGLVGMGAFVQARRRG